MHTPVIKQSILGKLRSVEQELNLLREQALLLDTQGDSSTTFAKKIEELQLKLTSAAITISASEKLDSFAINHLNEGIVWVDSNGLIIHMNTAAETYTGWILNEAVGKYPDEVIPLSLPNSDEPAAIPFAEVFSNRSYENNDKYYELKSKKDIRYKVTRSIFPINEGTNYFSGYLIVIHDHTEKYFLDKYLKASKHKLKLKLDYFLTAENASLEYKLSDIVYLNQLQKLQDAFSKANNVASCIIDEQSVFITKPNRFAEFLAYYSKKTGCSKPCMGTPCTDFDYNVADIQAYLKECPECHIISFAAPVIVGGKQLASWHIGQIALNSVNFVKINEYLKEFARDKGEYIDLHFLIFNNSIEDFNKKAELLLLFAKELSALSHKNLSLANEIELRKQNEQHVVERDQYLQAILSSNPGIITIVNDKGVLQNIFSAKSDLLFGQTTDTFIGKPMEDYFPLDIVDSVKKHISDCLNGQGPHYFEFPILTTNFRYWFSANISCISYNNETCALIVATDVTHLKNLNEALQKSQEEKRAILNNMPHLAWLKDIDGRYLVANNNFLNLFNTNINDLAGKTDDYLIALYPELEAFIKNNFSRNEQNPNYYENAFDTDYGRHWYETYTSPVYDSHGNNIGTTGISRDITERKASEENLATFKQFADNSSQGMGFTDLEGKIIYINQALASLVGFDSPDELIGKNYMEFMSKETRGFFNAVILPMLERDGHWIGELKRSTNENCTLIQNIFTIRDNHGNPIYYGDILSDISHQKAAENALKIAKEKAEKSDRLKSAFLANMSHEIRTPMNGILGFTNLLNDSELDTGTRDEYISIINTNGSNLLKLIDDILDIARIEAGEISIECRPFNINELMLDIHKMFESILKNKTDQVKIHCNIPENDAEQNICSDINRLHQVFSNLIGNAIKFTLEGQIDFGYTISNSFIHFYVKDTGIGIKEEHLPLIFERFRQIDDHRFLEHKGTGLGLTISYNIVKLLGGDLKVTSTYDQGTVFEFNIPIINTTMNQHFLNNHTPEKLNRIHFDWNNKTILIAEDEEMNFLYLKEVLKKSNVNIIHARDGEEAITVFKECEGGIDLIIMDIKMPKVDGLEATQAIKSINPLVPIIAHTAYAMEEDKQRCLRAGCDNYISKPINKDLFLNILNEYLTEN